MLKKPKLPKISEIVNVYSKNPDTAAAYKAGYDACMEENSSAILENEKLVAQIRSLGYEPGEGFSIIQAASSVKKACKQRGSCDGCALKSKAGCSLNGESPCEWRVM